MTLLRKGIIITLILLVLLKPSSFAQSQATAIVSTIVTEVVGVTKLSDIDIENVSGISKEIIEFKPTGIANVDTDIKIKSGKIAGIASFNIISNNYAYAITLPSSAIAEQKGGNQQIEIGLFNFINGCTQILHVCATLKIPASKVTGIYFSITPVLLTVNYN